MEIITANLEAKPGEPNALSLVGLCSLRPRELAGQLEGVQAFPGAQCGVMGLNRL